MTKPSLLACIISLLLISTTVCAEKFVSPKTATQIIELYTSEGCSSCPPADRWLRQLKTDPGLFKKFIPMAFHVDYWDQLGWSDRFASKAYSRRQYQHKVEGNIAQVYTPGFVVNNKEWRGWFNGDRKWSMPREEVGVLELEYQQSLPALALSFAPATTIKGDQLLANIAILGMNLSTEVKAGENGGRRLEHDFVVLGHYQQEVKLSKNAIQKWQVTLPEILARGQKQQALVVWLSYPNSQQIIQATGGYF